MMELMLSANNITKEYGSKQVAVAALNAVSFDVEKGMFLSIMGPSGSGKTTLLNILSTIDSATSGQVDLDGTDISKIKSKDLAVFRRDTLGFVFQDFNLLDNMTIQDNIALPLALNKVKVNVINEKVSALAETLGLSEQLSKYPYQISGGQKQRAATARALIANPKIIFADEPTGALDTKASAELLHCFSNLNHQYGTTIVMVTHDVYAASFSDKVMFLQDGKIYTDMYKPKNRDTFYQNILNTLAVMGGARQ